MSWFKKDGTGEEQSRPRNEKAMLTIRAAAAAYLVYLVYDLVQMYLKGGEDAPSLPLLLGSGLFLLAGAVLIAVMTYKDWKAYKKREAEEYLASLEEKEEAGEETEGEEQA